MTNEPQTWHYGLIAEWWAEFNDGFRAHEIPYFIEQVQESGWPVLDAGCGSGRLLVPFLNAGLDVDGCDVSADMVDVCRVKAGANGHSPTLEVQPLHELAMPRSYGTIVVCGTFGLGSTRERDVLALRRLHDHLEPGGTLLLDIEVPNADPGHWGYWLKTNRTDLPEPVEPPTRRRTAADGSEYALSSRIVDVDPLAQRITMEMTAQRWRNGEIDGEETRTLTINAYFPHEVHLLLEQAGFSDITLHGEHQPRPPTRDDDFIVFVARK